jgi:hypothetical protein
MHAIGYLIVLMLLEGCAQMPVCPQVTISVCPVPVVAK